MKKAVSKWVVLATMAAGLGMASSAHATWTFTSTASIAADATGIGVTAISGAYAGNGGALTAGVLNTAINPLSTYGISGFASGATWNINGTSALQNYINTTTVTGGLGMASDSTAGTAPNHALDNGPGTNAADVISGLGNTEAVLLGFGGSVVLKNINIGYKPGDADVSVFRFKNTVSLGLGGAPALAGTGATLTQMQTAGWELVGNYGDLNGSAAITNPINAGNLGSSWWLISAYNSSYGAATTGAVDQGNDYFKLYSIAGNACLGVSATCANNPPPPGVPEPASLALVAIAGLGAAGARRRKVKVAA